MTVSFTRTVSRLCCDFCLMASVFSSHIPLPLPVYNEQRMVCGVAGKLGVLHLADDGPLGRDP